MSEEELYQDYLGRLHSFKIMLQLQNKNNNLDQRLKNLKKFISKIRDRKHDFKAGYVFDPVFCQYVWYSEFLR